MSDKKSDQKADSGKRGHPPSLNKRHTKKHRKGVIVKATLDVYRVERLRGSVQDQMDRFEEMSKGGDGGKLKPHYEETIRKQHYKDWTDRDFKDLLRAIKKAIKEYDEDNSKD